MTVTEHAYPERERLPADRKSLTHKFTIIGCFEDYIVAGESSSGEPLYRLVKRDLDAYLTIGMYDDGRPGEIFLKIGKHGDFFRIYDAMCIAVSVGLQYGIPIDIFLDKFEHTRFQPSGITSNAEIPIAKSIVDYVSRFIRGKFNAEDVICEMGDGLIDHGNLDVNHESFEKENVDSK